MTIGEKIKRERIKKGLTQQALGEICGFHGGSASVMIRNYETGKVNKPREEVLEKIAVALDCDKKYFFDTSFIKSPLLLDFLLKELVGEYGKEGLLEKISDL